MEHLEDIKLPEPVPTASPEEVTGGLGLCVGFIIENARQRIKTLKFEAGGTQEDFKREDFKRSIKKLIQRTEILADGLDPAIEEERLADFIGYLKMYTGVMDNSLPIAKDNSMLADMVERYGLGLQSNMDIRGLLSDKAKEDLDDLRSRYEER